MATMEVTFFKNIPEREIPVPGPEISTVDTPTLVNSTPGCSLQIPIGSQYACFIPTADMRVVTSGVAMGSTGEAAASKIAPKCRKYPVGILIYIAAPSGGSINFLLEV